MWFKNLQVYRFTKAFEISAKQLSQQLAEHAFAPCGGQDASRYGWVPPLGQHGSDYVHVSAGYIMICAKKQEKLLPASVVNERLADQVAAIQTNDGRTVGRKERQNLKEDITFELLPRAFTRSNLEYAYIAVQEGLMIVNSASAKRAEELISYLRETIGSVPVIPIVANNLPQQSMTAWLQGRQPPKGFEFGHECELRDPSDESGIIRCKHQDVSSEEINNHIKAGMYVSKLGLCWDGGIEFVIDEQLAIKRLNFTDLLENKGEQLDAQDAAEKFDIDFAIMTAELSKLFKSIINLFGGEQQTQTTDDTAATAA